MRQTDLQMAHARILRANPTDAHAILWQELCARRLAGLKFRRQVPLGPIIADFYCASARLVVQTGGARSAAFRDAALRTAGFTVLRFRETDVFVTLSAVLRTIAQQAKGDAP